MNAAREYKDVLAGLNAAADELRARDRVRFAALTRRLEELAEAMEQVGERVALTRFTVDMQWEAALEVLWSESRMAMRPPPPPDPRADPAYLDALNDAVADRAAELREVLRRRRFRLRRS
ncbi:MAG: hypothetical protein ACRDRH_24010 [Pseudonocardia sp.]